MNRFGPSRLGRRLLVRLLLFAGSIVLVVSLLQLHAAYRRDVAQVEQRFALIEAGFLKSVTESVWALDRDLLRTLLEGLVRLPGFTHAEVRSEGGVLMQAGTPGGGERLSRSFPLRYASRGQQLVIGELRVSASTDHVLDNLRDTIVLVMVTNLLVTVLIAGFMYLMVRQLITRHLVSLAHQAEDSSLRRLDVPLAIDRPPSRLGRQDELDQLVEAYNVMRHNLMISYDEMRALNAELERRVDDRTTALLRQVEESMRHQRAMKSSQDQLQAIFESALEGIVVADARGMVTVFNPAAERLFGYRAGEMVGASLHRLMPEAVAALHDGYMRRYLETGEARIVGRSREVTACRSDGTLFPILLAVSEARVGDERLFIGIIHDLSERKRFEDELIEARVAAEQASHAKSEFLSRMSHELRTPLNAIIGFGQLLASDPQDPPTPNQKENIDLVLSAGRHLLDLVNEILDLARIESGRAELSLEAVNLCEVLGEQLTLLQPLADQAGLTLAAPLPGTACWVQADRLRLKQCLLNLLSNAIKYNRPQGSVTVSFSREGEEVAVAVVDTGIGFTEAQRERLFDPFRRLGDDRQGIEGTGIGLAITRRLVELMGGRIEVSSIPGSGSTFTIVLCVAEPPARGERLPAAGSEATGPADDRPLRVLYVEDNPANASLMQKALRRRPGVRLEVATDGEAGLARALAEPPDLLLLDINLPGMDGYEMLRRLRAEATTRGLSVIAVTANAMAADEERVREAGFDGYLTKPFELDDLYREIDRARPA